MAAIMLWQILHIFIALPVFVNSQSTNEIILNERLGRIDKSRLMPNFFFIGVSKCATSTMAELLTEHPLITAVGNKNLVATESHVLNQKRFQPGRNENIMNNLRAERVAKHLNSKNDSLIIEILRRGIIMEYTPSYSSDEHALQNLYNSIHCFNKTDQIQEKKFLMLIRNPLTRTASSWWFKEYIAKNNVKAADQNGTKAGLVFVLNKE
jgi:hypothetical protein